MRFTVLTSEEYLLRTCKDMNVCIRMYLVYIFIYCAYASLPKIHGGNLDTSSNAPKLNFEASSQRFGPSTVAAVQEVLYSIRCLLTPVLQYPTKIHHKQCRPEKLFLTVMNCDGRTLLLRTYHLRLPSAMRGKLSMRGSYGKIALQQRRGS